MTKPRRIPIESRTFVTPIDVTLEASIDFIHDHDLDEFEGEHYDTLRAVAGITVERGIVEFRTVRTIEAWKRGELNAGRQVYRIPRNLIEAIYI